MQKHPILTNPTAKFSINHNFEIAGKIQPKIRKCKTQQLLEVCSEFNISIFDIRFSDIFGVVHSKQIPVPESKHLFSRGTSVDGSSLPGWRPVSDADMVLLPDISTGRFDPFIETPTICFQACCKYPDLKSYDRDPRTILLSAINYVKKLGIADTIFFGAECEFFMFHDVKFSSTSYSSSLSISDPSISSTSSRFSGNSFPIPPNKGYFNSQPFDSSTNFRVASSKVLSSLDVPVEACHAEVAECQSEIVLRYGPALETAERILFLKYFVRNYALQMNRIATFIPKPIHNSNGSGMHVHCSLWKNGKNLFQGCNQLGFSELGLYFIGGILKHAPTICIFSNPSTNSYKRLIPGFEAPSTLIYSSQNRSAAIRVPAAAKHSGRFEYRVPDATANPYLLFASLIMAGLDGIANKIHPGEPTTGNFFEDSKRNSFPSTPSDIYSALKAAENDMDFLLRNGVFSKSFVESYSNQIKAQADHINSYPTPAEFFAYFGL